MLATRVLGVHGVGNLQPGLDAVAAGERIANWWREALHGLPAEAVDMQVYYYAHLLAAPTPQGDGDLDCLDQDSLTDIVTWACQMGAYREVAQGRLTQPARVGVEWVARHFGLDHKLAVRFVATFFPEVTRYFTDRDTRQQAVTGLAARLREWRPRVLIAHSLRVIHAS